MAKINGIRKVKEVELDEIELVCATEKYNALGEKNVTVIVLQGYNDGEPYTAYQICKDTQVIATVSESGKVNIKQDYKGQLKLVDENYYKTLGLDDDNRVKKTDIELEFAKQHVREQNSEKTQKQKGYFDKDSSNKEKQLDEKNIKSEENVKKLETELELPENDLESCTEIRDSRFYRTIPEARTGNNYAKLAYSKSKNSYIFASEDANGRMFEITTIVPSVHKSGTTKEIDKEGVRDEAIQNVMSIKGSNDAYSVKVNSLSSEIQLQELRYDTVSKQYMAAELCTTTQRPTKEQANLIDRGKNKEIYDEMEMLNEYKEAGYDVTKIEMLSEDTREKYEILDSEEIDEILNNEPKNIREPAKRELEKENKKEITREKVDEAIEEAEQEHGEKAIYDRPIRRKKEQKN